MHIYTRAHTYTSKGNVSNRTQHVHTCILTTLHTIYEDAGTYSDMCTLTRTCRHKLTNTQTLEQERPRYK